MTISIIKMMYTCITIAGIKAESSEKGLLVNIKLSSKLSTQNYCAIVTEQATTVRPPHVHALTRRPQVTGSMNRRGPLRASHAGKSPQVADLNSSPETADARLAPKR
jgi:hypothetical protein